MGSPEVIHAIQSVGDGTGQVRPANITPADISVRVREQHEGTGGDAGIEVVVFLDEETVATHASVYGPPEEDVGYDAIITIAGAPLPDGIADYSGVEVSVDISVDQVQSAIAAQCPQCRADLRQTFDGSRCTACGFVFDEA